MMMTTMTLCTQLESTCIITGGASVARLPCLFITVVRLLCTALLSTSMLCIIIVVHCYVCLDSRQTSKIISDTMQQ